MTHDPLSDMLTIVRNALLVKKQEVVFPFSKLKQNLAEVFKRQGWVEEVSMVEEDGRKFLRLKLQYMTDGQAAISGLRRLSKPGQRIYAKVAEIPRLRAGTGTVIISTSKGLMTDTEAKKEKMGGEAICQIW